MGGKEEGRVQLREEPSKAGDLSDPPENNVTYTYGGVDADFNRVDRVALVEDGSGASEFFYGRTGEVVKQRSPFSNHNFSTMAEQGTAHMQKIQ